MSRQPPVFDLAMGDRVAHNIWQVLVQGAAAGDVERLRAATDAEDRQLEPRGLPSHGVLKAVELRLGHPELHVRPGPVRTRGQVRPPGENEPVEASEHARDVPVSQRRYYDRDPTSGLDRLHVGHPERHLWDRRLAMTLERS